MIKTKFDNFNEAITWIAKSLLIGVAVLFISRLVFLVSYANWQELSGYYLDVIRAFGVGLKFDIKVLTIAMLPLALVSIVRFVFGNRVGAFFKFFKWYSTLVIFFVILFEVINFYFYKFYYSKISVIIFGFFEDDTWAVLVSIWKEYPVIPMLLMFIVVFWALSKLYGRLFKPLRFRLSDYVKPLWLRCVVAFFVLGLYFLGMYGNLGVVPLDGRHATISGNLFVNDLPINGLFCTKMAWKEREKSRIETNPSKMLKRYGFKSISEVASVLYDVNADSVTNETFYAFTPKSDFLKDNPPNVVFILMESMSNFYFDIHSDSCNLLGTLADVIDSCYLFRNFLPSSAGTIYSLESILVNSPKSPLSQSQYQHHSFTTSAVKPFYDKGYTNIFLTGGKMGWRDMDKFIPRQYFNAVEAEPTLRKNYPNGKYGEWGMHDEVLFKRAYDLLSQSDGKPYLIFGMTISHHTPYDIPDDYKPFPISLPSWAKERMKFDEDVVMKGLKAFQYANSCLGDFIKQVIYSPLGENTIIVATGDHNIKQNFEYPQEELFMKYSVPMLMYIPPKYRPKKGINTKRFASHKDIFPTLYHLALSDTKYLNFGNNLCDSINTFDFGMHCYTIAADSVGFIDFSSVPLYYKWNDKVHRKLNPHVVENDLHFNSLMVRAKALTAAMNWFIIKDVEKKKNN
jgi:phosphoglycerol transferase MdoB-like AlkP superfamily enzyme